MYRLRQGSYLRQSRREPDLNELYRTAEPHDANEHAPLYSPDKRILKEDREPQARDCASLHALQLRADS
jgi:hypothetical protein